MELVHDQCISLYILIELNILIFLRLSNPIKINDGYIPIKINKIIPGRKKLLKGDPIKISVGIDINSPEGEMIKAIPPEIPLKAIKKIINIKK